VERSSPLARAAVSRGAEPGRFQHAHDLIGGSQTEAVRRERERAHVVGVADADHDATARAHDPGDLGEGTPAGSLSGHRD
jgi:hypothetical protein